MYWQENTNTGIAAFNQNNSTVTSSMRKYSSKLAFIPLAMGVLSASPLANAAPTVVEGSIILDGDDAQGWYQVQYANHGPLDGYQQVCGETHDGITVWECEIPASGPYHVINHSTGARYENIQVDLTGDTNTGNVCESIEPVVQDSSIILDSRCSWTVQSTVDYSKPCDGSVPRCDNLSGSYKVNRWSGANAEFFFENIGGGGTVPIVGGDIDDFPRVQCHNDPVSVDTPLRKLVEHCGFERQGFYVGGMIKQNYGQTWFERQSTGCISANNAQFGECFNGVNGTVTAHIETAKREFNVITAENEQKWSYENPTHITSVAANLGVNGNTMALHGHAIVFEEPQSVRGRSVPNEVYDATSAEAENLVRSRVQQTLRSFKGKNLPYWDVVNEPLLNGFDSDDNLRTIVDSDVTAFMQNEVSNGGRVLRSGIIRAKLGNDWVRKVFTWARDELDTWESQYNRPDLVLNENDVLWEGPKSDALHALISYLNEDRRLVDGVGFQAHIFNDSPSDANMNTIGSNLQRFANIDVNIFITEADVRVDHSWWDAWSAANPFRERALTENENRLQSERFARTVSECLDNSRCKGWQTWGITDRFAWTPGLASLFSGNGSNATSFTKKPAYYAVHEVLCGRIAGQNCDYSSIDDTRTKPVEWFRAAAIDQAIEALESYASINHSYRVSGGGWGGNGQGWFHYDGNVNYPESVSSVLVQQGHLNGIIYDTLYTNSSAVAGDFLIYRCSDRVGVFSRHGDASLTSTEDRTWWDSNGCTRYPIDRLGADQFRVSQPANDVGREAAMRQTIEALESYGEERGTYRVTGGGWRDGGQGWMLYDNNASYTTSISDALTIAGHPVLLTDPLFIDSTRTVGDFLVYRCSDRVAVFSRHGGENQLPSLEDSSWWSSNGCTTNPIDRLNANYYMVSQPLP